MKRFYVRVFDDDLMTPFRKISGIDISVSPIGIGTWIMNGFSWSSADDRALEEALETSITSGINLIDTAPVYGFGRAEEMVGKTLQRLNCRGQVVLAAKFGLEWDDKKNTIRRNSRYKRLLKELDQSRRRLNTDVIDIYQIHWPDASTPLGETMDCLLSLYEAGLIRAIGVSNFSLDQLRESRRYAPVHVVQPPFNLFEQESGAEILPFCREEGIAVLAYGTLCRGLLTGKFKENGFFNEDDIRFHDPKLKPGVLEKYQAAVNALSDISRQKKCSLAQLAIAWVFHQEGMVFALAGARTQEQARMNAGAMAVNLSKDEMTYMEALVKKYVPEPIGTGFMSPPA